MYCIKVTPLVHTLQKKKKKEMVLLDLDLLKLKHLDIFCTYEAATASIWAHSSLCNERDQIDS